MNINQREQLLDAISRATLARFKSGVVINDPRVTVDEAMELYKRAHELVESAYRIVHDIYSGDRADGEL